MEKHGELPEVIQVVTTTEQQEHAEAIARALVEARLAACVQIVGPIRSTYRWQGRIETSQEWQCCAKGLRESYPAIEEMIRRLHPYDEPEILATAVVAGSASYLRWVETETRPESPS